MGMVEHRVGVGRNGVSVGVGRDRNGDPVEMSIWWSNALESVEMGLGLESVETMESVQTAVALIGSKGVGRDGVDDGVGVGVGVSVSVGIGCVCDY